MAGGTASFGVDGTGVYSVAGYIAGISEEVSTPIYINAVLRYAHGRLSDAFDIYLDKLAKADVDSFMHVYEWPSEWGEGDKPAYEETVGNPAHRLWVHTLSGPAQNAVASFEFLPSEVPSPVNPALEAEGVKVGVHIFEMKATVMEYGLPVHIEPKLAKYLAYVLNTPKGDGVDKGFDFAKTGSEGEDIGFSAGPVNINRAGGVGNSHTYRKFTDAFIAFYNGEAQDVMSTQVIPQFQADILRTANEMGVSGLLGMRSQRKVLNMAGWASSMNQAYGAAKNAARAKLKAQENTYIQQAQQRRREIYGV